MNQATRYLAAFLALGFVLAGIIVSLQTLTGERTGSYVFPCALASTGLFAGWLAWHFGSGIDTSETCVADGDDGDSRSQVEIEGGDAV